MLGVSDVMALPTPVRADAFALSRVNNRLVTGHWSGSLLRDVGMQIIITVVAFVFFFGIGSQWFLSGLEEIQLAIMPTATTNADIIEQWTARCGKNGSSTCYHVRYRYEVDGKPYFGEEQVDSDLYQYASLEPRMQITYAPGDPTIAHLGGPGVRTQRLLSAVPFVLLFAVFLLPAIGPLIEYLRVKRMLRKGTLIYGTITEVNGYTTGSRKHRRYNVCVNYEFTGPDGRVHMGEQRRTRRDLRHALLPAPGTPVAVAYVDDGNYLVL